MLTAKAKQIGDKVIVQVSGILLDCDKTPDIKVDSKTPTNTGRQFVAQMPPSCDECPISDLCHETIGSMFCDMLLWRHFSHA